VGADRTVDPGGRAGRTAAQGGDAGTGQCDPVFPASRHGLAASAARLSPWQTVYYYLRRWQREGVWERVHHALVMADRERAGREASPSAAILDSQSVKTADQKGARRVTTRARRSRAASAIS
jgi:transposase